jgi:hypothetical protein
MGLDASTIAVILWARSRSRVPRRVNNPNATFGRRASGGQIAVISKTARDSFHGAAYWFHQIRAQCEPMGVEPHVQTENWAAIYSYTQAA